MAGSHARGGSLPQAPCSGQPSRREDLHGPEELGNADARVTDTAPRHVAAFTVTDHDYFPGTLASVNSLLLHDRTVEVWVVEDGSRPLTGAQRRLLSGHARVHVADAHALTGEPVHDPWSLKALAAAALLEHTDVLVGFDSDCVVCGPVSDVVEACAASLGIAAPVADAAQPCTDPAATLRVQVPGGSPAPVLTSFFAVARSPENQRLIARWAADCRAAVHEGTGLHPFYRDAGVLSALLVEEAAQGRVDLLDSRVWAQDGSYWDAVVTQQDRRFVNLSAGGLQQRAFHCAGRMKPWTWEHHDRVTDTHQSQMTGYVWFLAMLWCGPCTDWTVDPFQYLPARCHHLLTDLIDLLPQVFQAFPPARYRWRDLGDAIVERAVAGIPMCLTFGIGRLTELIRIVQTHVHIRRFVEVGSYEGGALLALALRFQYRDIDFYAVESFTGNEDGTMDGFPLPSRRRYQQHLNRFPHLRARLVPGESGTAASLFDDGSLDMVFIDAAHDTASVARDIEAWLPKIAKGGILAGDDYPMASVRAAVDARVPDVQVTATGGIWWTTVPA